VWYDVVQNYTDFNLPLDTMWADIDYMDDYKIFTISEDRYGQLATYVKEIRDKGMTFVPIMDVGVAVRENNNYQAYDDGMKNEVFIQRYDK
jgi:alpha-glucosidase